MTAHEVCFDDSPAYHRGCETKLSFLTKADARRFAKRHDRRFHSPGKRRPYGCPSCGAIHLTSQARP